MKNIIFSLAIIVSSFGSVQAMERVDELSKDYNDCLRNCPQRDTGARAHGHHDNCLTACALVYKTQLKFLMAKEELTNKTSAMKKK